MIGRALPLLLGVGSQFLNTGSNLVLAVLVARGSSPDEFGWWATVNVGYYLGLQASRAMVSTPMMVDEAVEQVVPPHIRRQAISGAVGYATVMAATGALVAIALPTEGRSIGIVLALGLPGVLVGDAVRHVALRSAKGGGALGYDATWVALQAVGFAFLILTGRDTAVSLTLVWGASALVATVLSLVVGGILPRWSASKEFHRRHREARAKLLLESLLGLGVLQIMPAVLAVVATMSTAGAVRAAQTLYGPVTVLILALTPAATSRAVQTVRAGGSTRILELAFSGTVMAAAAGVLGLFALWPGLGTFLVGPSWRGAEEILLPMAIVTAFRGHAAVIPIVLRARRAFGPLLALRLRTTWPLLLLPAAGAIMWDLPGAAWALVLATAAVAIQNFRAVTATESSREDAKRRLP